MKTTPAQFVRQVKQEVSKITWPTRSETMQGTIVVIVMSLVLAAFLVSVDSVLAWAMRYILKVGA
jgi:preprotein translocase subunit SecE